MYVYVYGTVWDIVLNTIIVYICLLKVKKSADGTSKIDTDVRLLCRCKLFRRPYFFVLNRILRFCHDKSNATNKYRRIQNVNNNALHTKLYSHL